MADTDKHQPHIFMDVDELPMTPPFGVDHGTAGGFTQPPIPGRKSTLCGICHAPRSDRLHIEGEVEADAESPNWG
jgi:hypothetical protein